MFGIKRVDDAVDLSSVHKVKHLPNCVWELGNKMEYTEIILYRGVGREPLHILIYKWEK